MWFRRRKTMKLETIRGLVIHQNDGHNSEFLTLIYNVVNHLQIRRFTTPNVGSVLGIKK